MASYSYDYDTSYAYSYSYEVRWACYSLSLSVYLFNCPTGVRVPLRHSGAAAQGGRPVPHGRAE